MPEGPHRRRRILDLLSRRGYESISALAAALRVSTMTVRRDLDQLETEGLIRRTHGGALTEALGQVDLAYAARSRQSARAKRQIGRAAAELVQDGEVVFIDAGTTALAMAEFLAARRGLTIVTHSLPVAERLAGCAGVEVFLLGGQVRHTFMSVVGYRTEESLATFRFDRAFLGTAGIDLQRGLTHAAPEEIPIKKLAARLADQVVVLADRTKLGRKGPVYFLSPAEIDLLITDGRTRAEIRKLAPASARKRRPPRP